MASLSSLNALSIHYQAYVLAKVRCANLLQKNLSWLVWDYDILGQNAV